MGCMLQLQQFIMTLNRIQLLASNHTGVKVDSQGKRTVTDLVGFLDALSNVVACQGALKGAPPNQLGVSGPATELQRHIVHIDQLEA